MLVAFGDVNPIVAMIAMLLLSALPGDLSGSGGLVTSRLIARVGAAGLFFAPDRVGGD